MQDKNFEQQAQDMANGFEMEPSPASWQQIQDAIGKKRKRRIAIWWWLLPLCAACGVALYTFTQTNKQAVVDKNVLVNSKVKSKNKEKPIALSKPQKEDEKLVNLKTESKNKAEQTKPITPNKNEEKHEAETVKNLAPVALQRKNSFTNLKQNKNDKQAIYSSINKINSAKKITENNVADTDKNVQINKDLTKNADSFIADKMPEIKADKTFETGKNTLAENNKNLPDNETASAEKDSAVIQQKTNDSAAVILPLKQDTTATAKIKKQKTLHKWNFGIVAEGGIAARSSSVLSLNSLIEKSNTNISPAYFSLSAPNSNRPGSGGFFNQEQINNGAAYGFGIALQKAINKKVDFFADVSYQHQSSKISAVTYYDSILLNGSSNVSLAGSYNATQVFHFASLYTGFNWHFINKKNLGFGISAGADNFFLLAEKQNFGNISSSNVSQDYMESISRSALVKHDYYTYQPHLFAGILVSIKMPANQQLQLTPFVRSGIQKFEKNTSANNNHLFSGGLRAVYLFK